MGPRVSRPKRMLVSDRFDFHQSGLVSPQQPQWHNHTCAREILPPALDASTPEFDWLQILGPATFDLYFDFAWDTYDSTAWWTRIERGAVVSVQQNNRLLGRTT